MFLHVGADEVVSLQHVIAILDVRENISSETTRNFLARVARKKRVTDISGGEPKSLVLTDSEVFLSPISSLTLMKRANFLSDNVLLDLGI